MNAVAPGRGILVRQETGWVNGQQITVSNVSVGLIDLDQINTSNSEPGQVLMCDQFGSLSWQKPFESDAELRQEYPALEEAWGTLMEALEEYQMVKKLVQDHNE